MNTSEQEARQILADALEHEAAEHEAGRYTHLAECYDDVYGKLLPLVDTAEPSFQVPLYFLDSWGDAAQHEWRYYAGISREDWPRYARQIAAALRLRREITEPVLLSHFGPRAPSSASKWLRRLLGFLRPS